MKQILLYPNSVSVPLMTNFGAPPEPLGMLHVRLHRRAGEGSGMLGGGVTLAGASLTRGRLAFPDGGLGNWGPRSGRAPSSVAAPLRSGPPSHWPCAPTSGVSALPAPHPPRPPSHDPQD